MRGMGGGEGGEGWTLNPLSLTVAGWRLEMSCRGRQPPGGGEAGGGAEEQGRGLTASNLQPLQ